MQRVSHHNSFLLSGSNQDERPTRKPGETKAANTRGFTAACRLAALERGGCRGDDILLDALDLPAAALLHLLPLVCYLVARPCCP